MDLNGIMLNEKKPVSGGHFGCGLAWEEGVASGEAPLFSQGSAWEGWQQVSSCCTPNS